MVDPWEEADLVVSDDPTTLLDVLKSGRHAAQFIIPGNESGAATGLLTTPQFSGRFRVFHVLPNIKAGCAGVMHFIAWIAELESGAQLGMPELHVIKAWDLDDRGKRILVIDDSPRHRQSAIEELGSENDIVVLGSYVEGVVLLSRSEGVDVVLCDLLMPAESKTLGSEGFAFIGHEIAVGLTFALKAAQVGIPHIAVVTDANHHKHPMSAALDWIGGAYWNAATGKRSRFQIGASRAIFAHAPLLESGAKDWATVLAALLED